MNELQTSHHLSPHSSGGFLVPAGNPLLLAERAAYEAAQVLLSFGIQTQRAFAASVPRRFRFVRPRADSSKQCSCALHLPFRLAYAVRKFLRLDRLPPGLQDTRNC